MKLIYISEHYKPLTSGTTTYVDSVCKVIADAGHQVELIVPSNNEIGALQIIDKHPNWRIHYLGLGCKISTNIPRKLRILFVNNVNNYLQKLINEISPDIIHVLYGMFLLGGLKSKLAKVNHCVTIHNLPPRECGISWLGDTSWNYFRNYLRLSGVRWLNNYRLQRKKYDAYITVSYKVSQLLSQVLPKVKIKTIEHGAFSLITLRSFTLDDTICHLLTVAGYVPHKGQDLAIQTAAYLKEQGFNFIWTMIGPIRNPRYYQYLQDRIAELGLNNYINLMVNVSDQELKTAYTNTHIYVQPSLEEGFCLTALDAAFYGIPIVGTAEGAIPEIIRRGQGILTEPHVLSLAGAITQTWCLRSEYTYSDQQLANLRQYYSWQRVGRELIDLYTSLISNET